MEDLAPVEKPQEENQAEPKVPQHAAGGDPCDDGGNDLEDLDGSEDEDGGLGGNGNPCNSPRGWTMAPCNWDIGECFFTRRSGTSYADNTTLELMGMP
jgi:hypothetical protein